LLHKSGAKRRRHLLGFAFMACRAVAIGRNSYAGFCHDPSQLHYWRKHPDLPGAGWKSCTAKRVARLNRSIAFAWCMWHRIDRLEADIKESRLPDTEASFSAIQTGLEQPMT
jgi:hypothetical protein